MKTIDIGRSGLQASAISLGCMRIAKLDPAAVDALLDAALAAGINHFDHADIYGGGQSETLFGQALARRPGLRHELVIQSKCGIRQGMFDFSKEHILAAVDGSLRRLQTDYLDTLLLHRPDTLMEPAEVAAAFSALHASGKVRHFGVSNMNPGQIELLRKDVTQPLIAVQLQLSLTNSGMIDSGFNVNMHNDPGINRDGGILEYCRLHDITIQPWSPFQFGFFEGVFVGHERFPALNAELNAQAAAKDVAPEAIAIAWLLRHPAIMQPVVGTTNPQRLRAISRAADVTLSRAAWYALYRAAGNSLP